MSTTTDQTQSGESFAFQAEVSKLLDIVVHSLYSDRQIFLRELVSNASDACDKLRYESLTRPELLEGNGHFEIHLSIDQTAGTLTIADNGIGMNREDLVNHLGTIARSGTQAFTEALKAKNDQKATDVALIGQFGVGFYSSFMVADRVDVYSRRAGEEQAWCWSSTGTGSFTITESDHKGRGTRLVLHLRQDAREFLDEDRVTAIVKRYSDHIAVPVLLAKKDDKGEIHTETLNEANALWMRSREEITPDQYTSFYQHTAHAFDDPWMTLHFRAEGTLDYTALLFVPTNRPFDLFTPERKPSLKLYVNRVFITDDCEALLPPYLRFVRGIVDSSDLSLNISRELIQQDPRLRRMQSALTRRVLDELAKRAGADEADYLKFWETFGSVLKEGVYEDFERKDQILKLVRVRTTQGGDTPVSLETVAGRLKEGQKAIYYVTGDDPVALARSPQVEGFVARGLEVVLLSDPIDEFWVNAVPTISDKPLKSVAQAGQDLADMPLPEGEGEKETKKEATSADDLDHVIVALKLALGDKVADVRPSARLTDSPVCLVAKEGSLSPHLRRLLNQANKGSDLPDERILEINPRHALVRSLAAVCKNDPGSERVSETAFLLLDQARILEGEVPLDAPSFARRLTNALEGSLG